MKKTSLFFILIFSVFFSYQIAFAVNTYNFTTTYNDSNIPTAFYNSDADGQGGFTCSGGDGYAGLGATIAQESGRTWYVSLDGGTPYERYATQSLCNFASSYLLQEGIQAVCDPLAMGDPICSGWTGGGSDTLSITGGHTIRNYFYKSSPINGLEIYYYDLDINGGIFTPSTQGTYNESPYNGEVVATSGSGDVLVAFDYYLDDEQDPEHDTAQWCMRLVRNDGAGEEEYCDDVAFNTYTSVSHTFTGLALDSQWDWSIIFTRPGFFIDEYSILHAGSNYFFAGRFTIDSTVEEIYTAYTTCSITDLAGCFQNAIVFLFYPSQSSLNDFSSLYDAIKNKPPFGYISAVQTALQGINDTETGVFTLETIPILDTYIFTPVRTALIWIMWLAFIFMFYHRLKNIHL